MWHVSSCSGVATLRTAIHFLLTYLLARVSRYQKKHSPTHTHEEEEEEGFTQTTRSALSQRGLLDPVNPAYNQSQLDGWLIFTASTFCYMFIVKLCLLVAFVKQVLHFFIGDTWCLKCFEKRQSCICSLRYDTRCCSNVRSEADISHGANC